MAESAGSAAELGLDIDSLVPELVGLGVVAVELETFRAQDGNATFLAVLGAGAEPIAAGDDILVAIVPEARAGVRAALESLRATGRAEPFTIRFERRSAPRGPGGRDARTAWMTAGLLPGAPGSALLYVVDVTEQQTTSDALRESDERARRLSEASFEGLFIHDGATILDVNDAIAAMFRCSREAMVGRHAKEFTHPSCHALMMENVQRQYELPYELIGVRTDGSTFPIEVLGKPLPMAGQLIRVTAVRDLTERKRTEAALREAEGALQRAQKLESLGLLAGGIAHDFNNLLAVITAFAAVARRSLAPGAPATEALAEIDRAACRAADLTRQMLVYSGRSPKQVRATAIDDVVREIARLIAASFPKKVTLELDLADDLPVIAADRAQIEQVVMNLLTNAAEAIGDRRGEVRVTTRCVQIGASEIESSVPGERLPAGRYVALEVRDDGCGMDAAMQARIFDPFFTTKATGRGLGLSAMLGILRGHHAGLTIASAPGEGSTFRVLLPADAHLAVPAIPEQQTLPRAPAQGSVVLIAEDEPALRRATREVLAGAGHLVLEAADGAEAIDVFARHATDVGVVLLDLEMPVASGHEALEGIRAIDPGARIVLTSGFDAREVLDRLRGRDVDFVAKPWREEDLLAAIAHALARG